MTISCHPCLLTGGLRYNPRSITVVREVSPDSPGSFGHLEVKRCRRDVIWRRMMVTEEGSASLATPSSFHKHVHPGGLDLRQTNSNRPEESQKDGSPSNAEWGGAILRKVDVAGTSGRYRCTSRRWGNPATILIRLQEGNE